MSEDWGPVGYDRVTRRVVHDISKDHRAFIFRAQAVQEKNPHSITVETVQVWCD